MSTLPDDADDRKTLERFTRWLDGLLTLFQGPDSREQLTAAVGLWRGYPLMDEVVRGATMEAESSTYVLTAKLRQVHTKATRRLMREAERLGLDSAPLHEAGQQCQEWFAVPRPPQERQRGLYDSWPECLGSARYELPAMVQEAIRNGEAVLMRIVTQLDLASLAGHPESVRGATGGELAELADWASSELKGKERAVVEAIVRNIDGIALADLAVLLEWKPPLDDSYGSIQSRVNRKLKAAGMPWRLLRRDSHAMAIPIPAADRRK